MDASGFLRLVWPDSGYYIIATPYKTTKGFQHHFFETISAAAEAALSLDRQGKDVYFCISSAKEKQVWDAKKEKYVERVKTNMHALKVLFAEVDVAKPGEWETLSEPRKNTKYETREQALAGVKSFCTKISWPLPSVVSSGYGFHLYWPLTEEIASAKYDAMTIWVKRAARAFGFKLDTSALDISRVFRVVGTHNYKKANDPRPVELLRATEPTSAEALFAALRAATEGMGMPEGRQATPDYLDFGASNTERTYPESIIHFDKLLGCNAIKAVVDAKGDVPYLLWWHVGQIVRYAVDGDAQFHAMSSGSSNYSEEETSSVLQRFKDNNIGPTLCSTMHDDCPECNKDCPHWGKISTPLQLGRELKSLPPPVVVLDEEEAELGIPAEPLELPDTPTGFKRTDQGITHKAHNSEGDEWDESIYKYDIYPLKRVYNEGLDTEMTLWRTKLPHDGFKDILIPSANLYDQRELVVALASNGIYVAHDQLKNMRDYMIAYIAKLQESAKRDNLYSRLGWRENYTQFVLGNQLYENGQASKCDIERNHRAAAAISTKGSLEEWKEIVETFNHPEFLTHQFAFATAFGSPLMPFTRVSGGVINLLGVSGEGKSTIQKLVNSVWGHPEEQMLPADGQSSTARAKMAYMASRGNLPVCAEEITDLPAEDLSKLLMSINQGSDKWTATQDGKLKASGGMWHLTMLSSSNSSVVEKTSTEEGAAAKAYRAMEIRMRHVKLYSKSEFRQRVDNKIPEHYGLAGRVYAAYLTKHADKLPGLVNAIATTVEERSSATAEERVWVAIAASNIAGFTIAKHCGLHNMPVEPVMDFAIHQIRNMRGRTDDMRHTAEETLSEFLNENIRGILAVDCTSIDARANARVVTSPVGQLIARYDIRSGNMWVATAPFKRWCVKKGRVFQDILTELAETRVLLDRNSTKVLGGGTEYKTGQVRCITVDTDASGFADSKPEELKKVAEVVKLGEKKKS